MQRIGLQCLAVVFAGHPRQGPAPVVIDDDGKHDDAETPHIHFHMAMASQQAVNGFVNNPSAGDQQQQRLNQGAQVFKLSVPEMVIDVGRLRRDADGNHGDDSCHEVEQRVKRFGENTQRTGEKSYDEFG